MRKMVVVLSLLLSCVVYASQDTLLLQTDSVSALTDTIREPVVVRDTMQAEALTGKADDGYLLDILSRQSTLHYEALQEAERERMASDLTTLCPAHIGYADSIRISEQLKKQGGTSILCLPQLYRPQQDWHLPPLCYEWKKSPSAVLEVVDLQKDVRKEARRYLTTHSAELYAGVVDSEMVEQLRPAVAEESSSLYELYVPEKSLIKDVETDRKEYLDAIRKKNNPWFKELSTMLQFTQNYVSSNWYQGGNSALAMYVSAKGKILYNDRKRITWENTGEWVAGFSTVAGDSLRKLNTTDDLFRLYSKLGIKVVSKLYVSADAELRTQLFRTYNANAQTIKTGPFTPMRFNLAIGVDYKPVTGLSLVCSPLAYKFVCAADTVRSTYTSYGIASGSRTLNELGSSLRLEWKWKPLREIALETNFYTYTNYKSIELDLEVTCDFIINRFMSSRITLHPRYDSAHKTTLEDGSEKARIQMKELISIGFAHKFY